jgi:hypothetical protein
VPLSFFVAVATMRMPFLTVEFYVLLFNFLIVREVGLYLRLYQDSVGIWIPSELLRRYEEELCRVCRLQRRN